MLSTANFQALFTQIELLRNQVTDLHHAVNSTNNNCAQTEHIQAIRADIATLPTSTDIQRHHGELLTLITNSQVRTPSVTTTPNQRVFFSELQSALNATNALLANRPEVDYQIQQSPLPIEELFGQLHALHANSIKWYKHLEGLQNQATLQIQRLHAALPATADTNSSQINQALHSILANSERIINLLNQDRRVLDDINPQLTSIREQIDRSSPLDVLQQILAIVSRANPTEPPLEPVTLPNFEVEHPSLECRTHGLLVFDNIHAMIPMDITTRPPSTSLQLSINVTENRETTTVQFTIYDAGALIKSGHVSTPHRLSELPGDALFLIHQKCPNFTYKLTHSNVC
ncbi:hypothetical protein [Allexivirus sigmamedicagonis]|uniref:Uncharacterized protein n=1 Tax=Allexivirus sigmamedicagonis TaxID=1985968 RepID=A0A1X9PY61_9VIRU|nr:hypothetical protein [Alfalfa virus S]ARQ03278.1 hypothetical protein [Alfalfa virus S]